MRKRAVIKDGKVVNIIQAPSGFEIKNHDIVDIAENVQIGDIFENGKFSRMPSLPSVENLKKRLAEKRWLFETSGIDWNNSRIDTSRESQTMLTGITVLASKNRQLTIDFKTVSGFISLDVNGIDAMSLTVAAHVQDAFAKEAAAVKEIDAKNITTFKQVDVIFGGV